MRFPFFSKPAVAGPPWPWPACGSNPKTLSFRGNDNNIIKTMNSAYLDYESISESEIEDYSGAGDECAVAGALRSERLFFDPGVSSSILEEAKTQNSLQNDAVSILAMESRDPYADFRASMAEMVEAHELKDWDCLEELLAFYLRVNSKNNHGYIVGAFVDLLVGLAVASAAAIDENCSSSSTTTQNSFTSPLSFSSSSTYSSASPRLSSPENEVPITAVVPKKDEVPEFSSSISANLASASSSSSGV